MAKKRLYLKIFGEVHGVGFRYYTNLKAKALGLVGWARNADCGIVESEVEGDEEPLRDFLEWAKKGPRWARVERVEERWGEFKDEFGKFEVRY